MGSLAQGSVIKVPWANLRLCLPLPRSYSREVICLGTVLPLVYTIWSSEGNSGFVTHKGCVCTVYTCVWGVCSPSHITAAFPWHLYQVVVEGSGSSLHMLLFPAFLTCQAWCLPKGLMGPTLGPTVPPAGARPVGVQV